MENARVVARVPATPAGPTVLMGRSVPNARMDSSWLTMGLARVRLSLSLFLQFDSLD